VFQKHWPPVDSGTVAVVACVAVECCSVLQCVAVS